METLASRLKALRNEHHMTRQQLADSTGINVNTLRSYESYGKEPGHRTLLKLARAFNVTTDYLLGLSDEKQPLLHNLMFHSDRVEAMIEKFEALPASDQGMIEYMTDVLFDRYMAQTSASDEEALPHVYCDKPFFRTGPSAGSGNELSDDMETLRIIDTPEAQRADYVLRVDGRSMEPEFYNGDLVLVKQTTAVDDGDVGIFVVDGESFIKQKKPDRLHSINADYPDVPLNEFSSVYTLGKVIGKAKS